MADLSEKLSKSLISGKAKAYSNANNEKINAVNNASGNYINSISELNNRQNKQLSQLAEGQIQGTRQQFQKAYDYNAINSELNNRQIADRMANLGLGDSGINMTNQTGIAVSRINAGASVTERYNSAVSQLRSNLQKAITENKED